MARVLIVGCGCRGRALAETLIGDGHSIRGTTRDKRRLEEIEAVGAEAALADPGRLATLVPLLERVSVLCWLLGTARGEAEAVAALHGPRLESLLATIVDTPVRGFVYEAAGSVRDDWLERGRAVAERAAATHRMPVEILTDHPSGRDRWLAGAAAAVGSVLAA